MNEKQLKWELMRERFQIPGAFPPSGTRTEKPIRDILAGILQNQDQEAEDCLPPIIAERWQLITGEQLAKHTRPAHLKNGILYVHADHPGWLSELKRLPKMHLIQKISAIHRVNDVRFQLDPAIRTYRKL